MVPWIPIVSWENSLCLLRNFGPRDSFCALFLWAQNTFNYQAPTSLKALTKFINTGHSHLLLNFRKLQFNFSLQKYQTGTK